MACIYDYRRRARAVILAETKTDPEQRGFVFDARVPEARSLSGSNEIMTIAETSRFKIIPETVKSDRTLREDRGWIKMDVRWLVSEKAIGSELTVIGKTVLAPGIGSKHDLHRHPNAEEWEYVVHGRGIKHVGDESFYFETGDVAFVPRDTYHALENASDTEPLITLWGYSGAPSLEKAGYIIPEDDK